MQAMASSSRAIASLLSLIALMSLLITTVISLPTGISKFLDSGGYLKPGERVTRSGFTLEMRERDCNLVLYHYFKKVWESDNDDGGKGCRGGLKYDGSLAILNRENEEVWNSNNEREGEYPFKVLVNHRNGAVEIRDKGHYLVWSSNEVLKP